MRTVLITGGAGFIGSHTVDKFLKHNFKVKIIDDLSGGREENISHHKNNRDLKVEYLDIRKIKKNAVSLGIAYSFQKCTQIPVNNNDFRLDYIFTEKGIINSN